MKEKSQEHFAQTSFGFEWGSLRVTRCCSDEKYGVSLEITTEHERITIRGTPGGKLRVGNIVKILKSELRRKLKYPIPWTEDPWLGRRRSVE